jgi:hypothetical protein
MAGGPDYGPADLVPESWIANDNSGALIGAINADTSPATVANRKVEGLVDLGAQRLAGNTVEVLTALAAWARANGYTGPLPWFGGGA